MGNVPAWISAVGGVTATVAAICAAVFTWRALNRERQRDDERHEREQREQAELVAGWVDRDPPGERSYGDAQWAVRVTNGSSQPIYNVDVASLTGEFDGQPGKATEPTRYLVLPPGESEWSTAENTLAEMVGRVEHVRVFLAFTDCGGRRWNRDDAGQLSQVPSEPVKGSPQIG